MFLFKFVPYPDVDIVKFKYISRKNFQHNKRMDRV